MKARLLSIKKAEFLPAPYFGKNESGCVPLGDRVLVRPDIAMEKSSGGISIPEDVQERAQLGATTGVLVEVGDDAFVWSFDKTRHWTGYKPVAGDRVYFDRYAGKVILGKDGVEYRLMDQASVGGVEQVRFDRNELHERDH